MKVQQVLGQAKAVMRTTLLLSPLLVLTTLFSTSVSAQETVQPIPVYQFEHTSFNDRNLYIRGGLNQGRVVSQFYSLDISPLLSYSNKLTWKKLNEVGPVTDFRSRLPMAPNRNNQELTYFYEANRMVYYNLMVNKWTPSTLATCMSPANALDSVGGTQKAVLDPKTGITYVPRGYNMRTEMLVFDSTQNSCSGLPMPADSAWYNHAWSESKNTIYMYGTRAAQDTNVPASLWEFQFAKKTWKSIPIQGDIPIMHESNCMTSAYNGQKLIVYGGFYNANVYGDIYIFDTVTYKWTVGPRSPGYDAGSGYLSPPEIQFYNIKLNRWMTQAEIVPSANIIATLTTPNSLLPTDATTGNTANNTLIGTGLPNTNNGNLPVGSKTIDAAAIGGGVAGVVFIAAIVGLLFYRRGKKAGAKDGNIIKGALPGENSGDIPLSPEYQQAPFAPNSHNTYRDPNATDTLYTANSAAVYTTPYNPAYPPCTTASAPSPPYTEADENNPYLAAAAASSYSVAGSLGTSVSSHTDADSRDRTIYPLPTAIPIAAYQKNDSYGYANTDTKTHYRTTPSAPQLPLSNKNNSQPTLSSMPQLPQGFQQYRYQDESALYPPLSSISRSHPQLQGGGMVASETRRGSKEKMALAQVEDEQNMERIRQEQHEELERMREEWEQDQRPRRPKRGGR
ncbi:hypothetical protein BGZ96_004046 [Linnemannia gamsii]|uniref:Galactose oxidase n=1 Tax=Linnemannia gamsii TaxID=64522 RepID=A0ABQ7K901_9FUNG|nr:hypothetical protein BGZ96_004046 [Linnemannia gamsii]